MKITGHSKPVERLITGLHSFDKAFINDKGEIGYPLGKMAEVWGATHIGKSTVVHSLSGQIAHLLGSNVVLADLEDFDPHLLENIYITQGFDGEVHSVLSDKDESTLELMLDELQEQDYCIGILDSVGAISPYAERSGNLGDANMGQRARLMAQFTRRGIFILRSADEPKNIFLINHQHPSIGGFGMGYHPPGGETKKYLSSIRMSLKRLYIKTRSKRLIGDTAEQRFPDGSYCVHGKVVKNKWGLEGKEFYLFVLAGKGVHKGMTALLDAFQLGKVKRGRKYLKIADENIATGAELFEAAHAGEEEIFQPFYDILVNDGFSTEDENDGKDEND